MDTTCTKCGATLAPDSHFCTACGAPIAAAMTSEAPTMAHAPAPYAPHTNYPPPPPPPKTGPSALKIVLIVIAVFVGLSIIGGGILAYSLWQLARGVHVDSNSGKVTVNTPGGSYSVNGNESFTAAELGTEIYPGAQKAIGSARLDMPTESMVTGVFVTPDSKDQVAQFYKTNLGVDASFYESGDSAAINLKKGESEVVMVNITANSGQDDGKTRIAIIHTTKKKSS